MALEVDHSPDDVPVLDDAFVERLEASLVRADWERRRQAHLIRLRRGIPVVAAAGLLIVWRLTLASPSGVHAYIAAIATLSFFLDVAVHLDSALLTYLSLSWLPSTVGFLVFLLVTGTLLWRDRGTR